MLASIYSSEYVSNIALDDMSNNFNKPNNMYLKLGLTYVEKNNPEMIGNLVKISEYWDNFKCKYKNRNFFCI